MGVERAVDDHAVVAPGLNAISESEVYREQVQLLFGQAPAALTRGLVTGLAGYLLLVDVVDSRALLVWLLSLIGVTGLRLAIVRLAQRKLSANPVFWARLHIAGAVLGGLVWGLLMLMYAPDLPDSSKVVMLMLLAAVTAAAIASNSAVFAAYPAFFVPIVAIEAAVLFFQHSTTYWLLAVLLLVFAYQLYSAARKFNHTLLESLRLRFANQHLAERLGDTNLGLQHEIGERQKAERALREANRKLTDLATLDGLTAIPNRRSFDSALAEEWARLQRAARPLSLLMADVDFFKQYNDHYGHLAGDECLKQVARILSDGIARPGDQAARFGGEEFVLLLPETAEKGASEVAERIRLAVIAAAIPHAESAVAPHVTISIGVATEVPRAGRDACELVRAADDGLYRAKEQGRNRSVALQAGGDGVTDCSADEQDQ